MGQTQSSRGGKGSGQLRMMSTMPLLIFFVASLCVNCHDVPYQFSLASQPLLTQTARKGLVNGVACGCPRGMRMTSLNMTSLPTNMRFTTVVARLYIRV